MKHKQRLRHAAAGAVPESLRRTAMWLLASTVAAIAAIVSYSHIYELGREHGGSGAAARLLPLSVDALILVGELMLLHEADAKGQRFTLGWVLVWSGILATLAANVAYGAQFGWLGALIWGWPAYSFILAAGGMVSIVKRSARDRDVADAAETMRVTALETAQAYAREQGAAVARLEAELAEAKAGSMLRDTPGTAPEASPGVTPEASPETVPGARLEHASEARSGARPKHVPEQARKPALKLAPGKARDMSPEQVAEHVAAMLEEYGEVSVNKIKKDLHVATGKAQAALEIARREMRKRTVVPFREASR